MKNKTTSKAVKVGGETYSEMEKFSRCTGIPIVKVIEKSWIFFKASKTYANLILFGKED